MKASAYAKAEEKAKVWLKAWASAVSTAEVCGKCETKAEATVDILEEVLLHAVAEVYVSADEKSDDPDGCAYSSFDIYAWASLLEFAEIVPNKVNWSKLTVTDTRSLMQCS